MTSSATRGRAGGVAARRMCDLLVYCYPLGLLLLAWEAVARAGLVRPLFLPTVASVLVQSLRLWQEGQVLGFLLTSLFRAFGGLALAAGGGIALGIAMARFRSVRWLFDPLIAIGFPSPKIAFLPIFILWFGIDHLSKVLIVAFTCVFPMVVSAYHGAAAVPQIWIWSARAMGTPARRLLWRIVLPASLPYLFSGLRVAMPVALITAFTAEMVAGGGGLGAALMFAQRFFETPTVFVYLVLMLLTGFLFDRLMLGIRRRAIGWHEEEG